MAKSAMQKPILKRENDSTHPLTTVDMACWGKKGNVVFPSKKRGVQKDLVGETYPRQDIRLRPFALRAFG